MKKFFFFICLLFAANWLFAQTLSQTVRGTVFDLDTKIPLAGVQISLAEMQPPQGAVSDAHGNFRLENVPVGRITLQANYLGYQPLILPNIVVNANKEVVLTLDMQESVVAVQEVSITATTHKADALNDLAIISARSISPEETNRYAGGFNDPSRILSNFAGITSTQDGSNDIIVRGNSPKYIQWRLEGEQITNPNHFGDQSSVGGSISTLNNTMLAASDFHTGAFTPEFGDALSGVYDLRLRNGNNEKIECMAGIGLLGLETTLEGPFKKGYGGSFLVNYRYSTAGLISQLGLVDNLNGVLSFQDATYKLVFPTQNLGNFTVFGLAGWSSFKFEDITPAIWVLPGNNAILQNYRRDFDKTAHLFNTGVKHSITVGQNGLLNSSITYSNDGIGDDIFETGVVRFYDGNGEQIRDSVVSKRLQFQGRLKRPVYRASLTYSHKFSARHKVQAGVKYALFDFRFNQQSFDSENQPFTLVDFSGQSTTIRTFASWRYRPAENFTLVAGVHNVNVLLTGQSTIEPRLALNWSATDACTVHLGYGKHSAMESIHHYFAKVETASGISEPNHDLGLLKADHLVLGFERYLGPNFRAKLEGYYQWLADVPVENNDTSYFSTLVEGLDFRYVELVNRGKGRNYGVEFTVEKFFSHSYYFLVNASLFQSKYTPLDGVERNTAFNGNYLLNILAGKEFAGLGRKGNKTLGFNVRAFFGGARKIIPLLRDAQGQLAVDPANNRFWDYSKAFEAKLDDPYQIQLSVSYKWQNLRATHELFLNLENVTNHKGRIMEFYDESEPGKIGYMQQVGIFPNLLYRIYF